MPHDLPEPPSDPERGALSEELEAAAQSAERRALLAWIATVVLLLIFGAYLGFAYGEVRMIDNQFVADNIHQASQKRLPTIAAHVRADLENNASTYVGHAEKALLGAPKELRMRTVDYVSQRLRTVLEKREKEIQQHLTAQIETLATQAKRRKPDASDREQLRALLDEATALYGAETKRLVNRLHRDYRPKLKRVYGYLNRLARGRDLSDRERRQKRLLETMLALQHTWARHGDASPILDALGLENLFPATAEEVDNR